MSKRAVEPPAAPDVDEQLGGYDAAVSVEVPAHVQAAFDDAADIMSRAFPTGGDAPMNGPCLDPSTLPEHQQPLDELFSAQGLQILGVLDEKGAPLPGCSQPLGAVPDSELPSAYTRILDRRNAEKKNNELRRELEIDLKVIDREILRRESLPRADAQRDVDESAGEPFAGRVIEISVRNVVPDPDQPRLEVDTELADSIKAQGVLQPIVVRRDPTPGSAVPFMLVDGERRWRAAVAAGLDLIPARVVSDVDDAGDRLLHQVTLNEGKRLAPMEEAKAWARIMAAKSWNIQQLAAALGRAKSTVSDRLAMLNAPAAFQPLFAKGVLTPAAAPIVRALSDVPERFLTALVEDLSNSQWADFIAADTPIPLGEVKTALAGYALHQVGLRRLDHLGQAGKGYAGPTCTIDGKTYATDADQLEEVTTAYYRGGSSSSSRNADVDDYQKRQADENRKRRQKRERTTRLRRAQFDAISAKLPTSIDANAALFLIDALVREMQLLSQAAAAKALGIETPAKKQYGSPDWPAALVAYAKQRDAKGRARMLLQLAMGTDLQVSEYEPDGPGKRLVAAAAAFRVDLKKVKAPDPDAAKPATKKPAATKAKAKPAKKGGRR